MQKRTVEELIVELQQLRLQETAIIAELREATREQINQVQDIDVDVDQPAIGFALTRGSRVRIKNRVRRPATAGPAWNENRERLATVTRVTVDQVHIVTDNGTRTWRAPNNLALL
jgi:hypothetical protein